MPESQNNPSPIHSNCLESSVSLPDRSYHMAWKSCLRYESHYQHHRSPEIDRWLEAPNHEYSLHVEQDSILKQTTELYLSCLIRYFHKISNTIQCINLC